jgi:multisubunit Na+/H+ antiporter MnhB subunit
MKQRGVEWLVSAVLLAALVWGLLSLPRQALGLTAEAQEALSRSGATNPVTAVLLNYRSYDTLLEVAVMLLAILVVWSLQVTPLSRLTRSVNPLLVTFLKLLLPFLLLVGGYLLWVGAKLPGGAFQGGALLASAFVLLVLSGLISPRRFISFFALVIGFSLGLLVFAGVGLGVMVGERRFLEYPVEHAGGWILTIEAALFLSTALTLGLLFLMGRPVAAITSKPNAKS